MPKENLKLSRREMLKVDGGHATGIALSGTIPFTLPQFNISKTQSNGC